VSYLADTNILTRWAQPHLPEYPLVISAVEALLDQAESVFITPQNLVEFWSVATRPLAVNGLGMSLIEATQELQRFELLFPLLPDIPAIYPEWRNLVLTVGVSGRQVHDTRLAAVMRAHNITHLLTFNPTDFARFPGIIVVHPQEVPTGPPLQHGEGNA
jgi:predicted nucleic acid-binding protein